MLSTNTILQLQLRYSHLCFVQVQTAHGVHGRSVLCRALPALAKLQYPAVAPHLNALEVAAEGGQVSCEALLVSDVRQHGAEGGQAGGRLRGQRQARLGHQGGQAQRLNEAAMWWESSMAEGQTIAARASAEHEACWCARSCMERRRPPLGRLQPVVVVVAPLGCLKCPPGAHLHGCRLASRVGPRNDHHVCVGADEEVHRPRGPQGRQLGLAGAAGIPAASAWAITGSQLLHPGQACVRRTPTRHSASA